MYLYSYSIIYFVLIQLFKINSVIQIQIYMLIILFIFKYMFKTFYNTTCMYYNYFKFNIYKYHNCQLDKLFYDSH